MSDLQKFKPNDLTEQKVIDAVDPLLVSLGASRDQFYEEANLCAKLGEVLYDLMRDPMAGSMDRETYINSFPAIHQLFTRPATFDFYLDVFQAIWGDDVDVEFIIPSAGKLTINIGALGTDLQSLEARRIEDNAYVYETIQETASEQDILLQIPKGLKTQAETDALVREINAAGIIVDTNLVLDGFNPSKISGAKLAFEAWRTQTMTLSSGKVTQWRNRVSSGPNFAQSVEARQPSYVPTQTPNNRGVVRFTTGQLLELGLGTDRFLSPTSPHTLIVVAKRNADAPGVAGQVMLGLLPATGSQSAYWMYRAGNFEFDAPSGWNSSQWSQTWSTTGFHKLLFTYSGANTSYTNYALYYDEVLKTVATSTGSNGAGNVLGNYQSPPDTDWNLLADVCAVYFYDRVLDSDEISDIYDYLDTQIGV